MRCEFCCEFREFACRACVRTHQSFGVNLFKWHHWPGAQSTSSKMLQWPAAAATGTAAMTMTTMLASALPVEGLEGRRREGCMFADAAPAATADRYSQTTVSVRERSEGEHRRLDGRSKAVRWQPEGGTTCPGWHTSPRMSERAASQQQGAGPGRQTHRQQGGSRQALPGGAGRFSHLYRRIYTRQPVAGRVTCRRPFPPACWPWSHQSTWLPSALRVRERACRGSAAHCCAPGRGV